MDKTRHIKRGEKEMRTEKEILERIEIIKNADNYNFGQKIDAIFHLRWTIGFTDQQSLDMIYKRKEANKVSCGDVGENPHPCTKNKKR